jgi:hypothetical protein
VLGKVYDEVAPDTGSAVVSPVETEWPQRVQTSDLSASLSRGLSGSQGDQKEPLEYLEVEDADLTPHARSGWMERLGNLILSKETTTVLQSVRSILAAYGQGLELSHAEIVKGIMILEKFYLTRQNKRTGDLVRDLGVIEKARHFFRYALAVFVSFVGSISRCV